MPDCEICSDGRIFTQIKMDRIEAVRDKGTRYRDEKLFLVYIRTSHCDRCNYSDSDEI